MGLAARPGTRRLRSPRRLAVFQTAGTRPFELARLGPTTSLRNRVFYSGATSGPADARGTAGILLGSRGRSTPEPQGNAHPGEPDCQQDAEEGGAELPRHRRQELGHEEDEEEAGRRGENQSSCGTRED